MRQQKAPIAQAVSSRLSAPCSRCSTARDITRTAMGRIRSLLKRPAILDGPSGSLTETPSADDLLSRQGGRDLGAGVPETGAPADDCKSKPLKVISIFERTVA